MLKCVDASLRLTETQSLDIFGLTNFKNIRVRTERFRRYAIFFNKIFVELLLAVFMTLQLLYNDLPGATGCNVFKLMFSY